MASWLKLILICIAMFWTPFVFSQTGGGADYQTLMIKVDKLIQEQKLQAALDIINGESQKIKSPLDQARIFTKILQLESGLHDYETAVKKFREKRWPQDLRAQALLKIYYAFSLQQYARAYGHEIRRRTKVVTQQSNDLKQWTIDEIYAEATGSLVDVWKQREDLAKFTKADLNDFIRPNNYPEELRETLRDSMTFLFVELLNDSGGWSAEQSNELYRLNIESLMSGHVSPTMDLSHSQFHPLEKIAYVLDDLKKWKQKTKNFNGALDAQISLIKILHDRMSAEKDREAIRNHLSLLNQQNQSLSWSSMGAGVLAQFWMKSADPEALMKAKKIAESGARSHPKSLGAALCRDLQKSILSPSLELQGMSVDGDQKRSLGIQYKNLKKIFFRTYRYDLKERMIHSLEYSYYPNTEETMKLLQNSKPYQAWTQDLFETTDYRTHQAFSVPPKHEKGQYIVVASMKDDFSKEGNILKAAAITISDLVLAVQYVANGTEFEVRHGQTGALIPNVTLEIYERNYNREAAALVKTIKTDAKGRGIFINIKNDFAYKPFVVIATQRDDFSFLDFHQVSSSNVKTETIGAIVYTDRGIYRPLQKIKWKAIFYRQLKQPGKFQALAESEQDIGLYDMNNQLIETKKVKTDGFGAAWGELTIPSGKALGRWSVRSAWGQQTVQVEEYKRPTFEISWKEQKTPIKLNQKAELLGEAKYYFGAPVPQGKVKYSVLRKIQFPWWCFWGRFFDFGFYSRDQIIETAETSLNSDGTFKIQFFPAADDRLVKAIDGLLYTYEIQVDIVDDGGETRTSSKSIVAGARSIQVMMKMDAPFILENQKANVEVRRQLLSGDPAPGVGRWELQKLQEPEKVVMPAEQQMPSYLSKINKINLQFADDKKQPRWRPNYDWKAIVRGWSKHSTVEKGITQSNVSGLSHIGLPALKSGAYRLVYTTQDRFGAEVVEQSEFFVANAQYKPALPGLFFLSKSQAKVGETLHVWLPTGMKNQTVILESYQEGELIQRKHLNSSQDSLLLSWPIKESHRGGVGFIVRLLSDYQELQLSQSLFVPWDNQEISMEFSTFRERIRPGQKETWSVRLKGPNRENLQKASVQLLAYMYDRSLDQLAPHTSSSVLHIYPRRSATPTLYGNLGAAPSVYLYFNVAQSYEFVEPQGDQLISIRNYGIGGPGGRGRHFEDGAMLAQGIAASEVVNSENASMLHEPAPASPTGEAKKEKVSGFAQNASLDKNVQTKNVENPLRSNFEETAFFLPHLTNSEKGQVEIQFEAPDSVTSWTLWLQALTKDLKGGSLTKQTQTVKELVVRPYLPRFLREGDQAQIRFVLNNTSTQTMSGVLNIELTDEAQKESFAGKFKVPEKNIKNIPFSIAPQKSFTHEISMLVPAGLGALSVKAMAKAGSFSDGELRSLPILPGRFHLAQSKFVTLKDVDAKTMSFSELQNPNDPTRINERMVVQVDAQLFYSVLTALPYLVNYPYECTEQTLNRFLSTGIMSSLYNQYPAIEKMAQKFSARTTRYESFDAQDPNRRMSLEETPWLRQSRGGTETTDELTNVLDSRVNRQNRNEALDKLGKMQTASGGFPWFAGGAASPDMTLYVVHGFSKAMEFGVDVPKPMIEKAWAYLHQHYLASAVQSCIAKDSCWEFVTFLNYVISNYPDASWGQKIFSTSERMQMLNFSFKHWQNHSPYLKGYLALTLHRAQRSDDAKLVWASVMDSAKFSEEEGTHWAREDRSWLWYNDTIETHAFSLRTLMELGSDDRKRDGLVQWLFLNKKLNHWKSTRATAEVIYSLAHYLTKTKQLGKKESVNIQIGSDKPMTMDFSPDQYTGKKNQIVYEAEQVKPNLMPIQVQKKTPGFMFASVNWQFSTEQMPKEAVGDFLSVSRSFYLRERSKNQDTLKPLTEGHMVQVGDEVEVHLSLKSKHPVEYVHLRDPRGAGFEPVNSVSQHKWELGISWYEEIRDSGTNFFFERLPQGEYNFRYRLRAANAGEFKVNPATVQPMYAPEFAAYSAGTKIKVK